MTQKKISEHTVYICLDFNHVSNYENGYKNYLFLHRFSSYKSTQRGLQHHILFQQENTYVSYCLQFSQLPQEMSSGALFLPGLSGLQHFLVNAFLGKLGTCNVLLKR